MKRRASDKRALADGDPERERTGHRPLFGGIGAEPRRRSGLHLGPPPRPADLGRKARVRPAGFATALLALLALLALPPLAEATLVPISGHRGLYKPTAFCPANQTCFSDATWMLWTHRRAVALATETLSCPGAEPSECNSPAEKVRVTFTQPRHLCGGARYTRAHWRPELGVNLSETTVFDAGLGGVGGRDAVCIWSGG